MHFIRYEDLIKDARSVIRNLYVNLGVDLSDAVVDQAVASATVELMAASEQHYQAYNPNYKLFFVGKSGKLRKEDILTDSIRRYIYKKTQHEIKMLFPEIDRDTYF
jgi:hypothetical protein